MANQVNKLTTKFVADTKQFDREIKRLKTGVKVFSAGVAAATAAAAVGFSALAITLSNTSVQLDKIGKQAQILGIRGKDLQILTQAADLAGVSYEALSSTLERVGFRVNQAARGQKLYSSALKELNLDAKELSKLSIDKQFESILKAVGQVGDRGSQISLLRTLGGREAVRVINLVDTNMQSLRETFDKFGLGLSQEQFKAIADYRDNVSSLNNVWMGFKAVITAEVVPAFSELIGSVLSFIKESGGIKPIAIEISNTILNTINNVKSIVDITLTSINNIASALNKVQSAGSAVMQNIRNTGVGYDPSNLDSILRYVRDSRGESFIPNLNRGSRREEKPLESAIPSIVGMFSDLGSETARLTESISKSTNKIDGMIASFVSGQSQEYLRNLLQPSLQNRFGQQKSINQFALKNFEKQFRNVFEQVLSGGGSLDSGPLNRVIERLERDALSYGTAQRDAVKELRQFAQDKVPGLSRPDNMAEQRVKIEGKVAVFPDQQSFIAFTQNGAREIMAREAASTGADE